MSIFIGDVLNGCSLGMLRGMVQAVGIGLNKPPWSKD